MTTAAPGRFANYSLARTTSAEKPPQAMAPAFGNNPWKPDGIWGNSKNVIGSNFSSQRELPGSRGSDDASPTTISGSAQLNHQSEAETPTWPRNGIWSSQDNSNQVRPGSGTASPSQTRDVLGQQSAPDSHIYQPRSVVGQNGNAFASRSKVNSTFAPTFGGLSDNLENGSAYSTMGSKFAYDGTAAFKRGSQGEFPGLGQNRENSISGQRPTDFGAQTNGSISHDLQQYSFDGSSRGSISRPAAPHQSVSFPLNGNSSRIMASAQTGLDQGLSNLLSGSLSIDDSRVSDTLGNDFPNPTSRPFQFNPSSQTWGGEPATNSRSFGQPFQPQGAYGDQVSSYLEMKRGSVDRASPSSVTFPRNGHNSPRYTPGMGSRTDSWSQSRPISRGQSMAQEYDRQLPGSFSQIPNGYYANGTYYGNNFPTQYQQISPYEVYAQNPSFRGQSSIPQYGMVNQYMPQVSVHVPSRPSRDQDPGKGVRSALLEDFRASNRSNKRFELKDIYGHVVEFSGDQHGSRFIQEKLQNANSDEKDQIFQEIQSNAVQLMKDVFGNYVIQKFFEHGSQVQKTLLAREMMGKVLELSTQMYACRVVQKALEHVLVNQQAEFVDELKPEIMRIVKDQNGNHVVQKIIQVVPQMCVTYIMDLFDGQISTLAAHNYGCRVIQRLLECGIAEEKERLMQQIYACAPQLIADTYGNYVAQHIIVKGASEDRAFFIDLVIDQLVEYSMHKFASNVVEKCVEWGSDEERRTMMMKLTTPDSNNRYPLDRVMLDQYGNYVMQKMCARLQDQDKAVLINEMKERFAFLKKTVNSRQMGAIERLLQDHVPWLDNFEKDRKTVDLAGSGQPTARNPAGLQIDSTSHTPALTSENSSPKTASSPSTKSGDETVSDSVKLVMEPALEPTTEIVSVDGVKN